MCTLSLFLPVPFVPIVLLSALLETMLRSLSAVPRTFSQATIAAFYGHPSLFPRAYGGFQG
jgi:hypothetical protein